MSYSADQRRELLKKGKAIPNPAGGAPRYPINNRADLEKAIRLAGHGTGSKALIRRHIIRRARALGLSNLIPDDWQQK